MRSANFSGWICRCTLAVVLLCATAASAIAESSGDGHEAVVSAIRQRVCFEAYWWNRNTFRLGETASLSIRQEGNVAYVWTDELSLVPGVSRWANFFTVFSDGVRSTVGSSYGYNLDVMRGTPDLEKVKSQVFARGATVKTVRLALPPDCTPRFAVDGRERQKVLKAIDASIATELKAMNRSGGGHYGGSLRIVVANFNADYPATMVLVPSTGELFHVTLQDSGNPLSDAFLKRGEYLVREENNKDAIEALKGKIKRFGIAQEIRIEADR